MDMGAHMFITILLMLITWSPVLFAQEAPERGRAPLLPITGAAPIDPAEAEIISLLVRHHSDELVELARSTELPRRNRLIVLRQTIPPVLEVGLVYAMDPAPEKERLDELKRNSGFAALNALRDEPRTIERIEVPRARLVSFTSLPLLPSSDWEYARDELDLIDHEQLYAAFHDAGAVLAASRVGFSADGRSAVVYIVYMSGYARESRLVQLDREEGRWEIVREVTVESLPGC